MTRKEKGVGYGVIYTSSLGVKGVSMPAKALYAYLCSLTGSKNFCFPKIDKMADFFDVSSRSIIRYLEELINAELIKKSKRKDFNLDNRNKYVVYDVVEDIAEGELDVDKSEANPEGDTGVTMERDIGVTLERDTGVTLTSLYSNNMKIQQQQAVVVYFENILNSLDKNKIISLYALIKDIEVKIKTTRDTYSYGVKKSIEEEKCTFQSIIDYVRAWLIKKKLKIEILEAEEEKLVRKEAAERNKEKRDKELEITSNCFDKTTKDEQKRLLSFVQDILTRKEPWVFEDKNVNSFTQKYFIHSEIYKILKYGNYQDEFPETHKLYQELVNKEPTDAN